ncbi:MAG: cob(I)yrinic acid a,c-diamide adenosyltransferase [Elusimicrobia bacterium]|nr:cob(I)yrinic acid a,c-diamide adenosyltransferase [Elusimicrobiota bacterium]
MKRGLIQIYTGQGKGKTTAACGLAVRAIAHQLKVGYIHFHKNPVKWDYGELKILKKLGVDIYGFAHQHYRFYKNLSPEKIRQKCLEGLEFIKIIYQKNNYDILILDEIIISLRDGLIKEEELLEIFKSKPKKLELVLTGRGASRRIIQKADLVSKILNVKHPYNLGWPIRKGIEY